MGHEQRYGISPYYETDRLKGVFSKGKPVRQLLETYDFTVPQGVPGREVAAIACGQVLTVVGSKQPEELTGLEMKALQSVQDYLS